MFAALASAGFLSWSMPCKLNSLPRRCTLHVVIEFLDLCKKASLSLNGFRDNCASGNNYRLRGEHESLCACLTTCGFKSWTSLVFFTVQMDVEGLGRKLPPPSLRRAPIMSKNSCGHCGSTTQTRCCSADVRAGAKQCLHLRETR